MAAIKNKKAHAARKIVSRRLRAFFASLEEKPSTGVEDLWKRAEAKLGRAHAR